MKFPRYGCAFCHDHHDFRYTHNTHLDSFIKEVTKVRVITPAVRKGQHFLGIIRAVRRRSSRSKKQPSIAIKSTDYDCCAKWKLYHLINNESELQAFETRILPTAAAWKEAADAFVLHRAGRAERRRQNNDSDLDTDTDIEDGFIPKFTTTAPPTPRAPRSISAAPGGRRRPAPTATTRPQSACRPERDDEENNDEYGYRGEDEDALVGVRMGQHHVKTQNQHGDQVFHRGVKNYSSLGIGSTMTYRGVPARTPASKQGALSRKRVSPISLLTPSPVKPFAPASRIERQANLDAQHNFDLPTPVKPGTVDITLVFREIGKMVLPSGTQLPAAVAAIEYHARLVLGAGAGPVKGVRDGEGSVDVARWDARSGDGAEWRVSIEWEW